MNKVIYRVRIIPGGTPLEFRMQGGGIFSNYKAARNRYESLKRHGCQVVMEQAIPDWEEAYA